ncbi:hypothetical protein [Bacillus pumilus]|uniref:hypothetical protein n=1 Tax=Bacillus pumilus TaxID=1408 RepID=UPI0016432C35|nr:hypothetical protein [Bacillus pumilus]
MDKSLQDSLVEAINILIKEGLDTTKYTSSNIGLVKSVKGFGCVAEVQGNDVDCVLMEHLHDWIQKDDIVIVQDLYNDNQKKAVIGKIGTSRPDSFTILDTDKGKSVSGVEQLYDESTGEVDVILEIE